MTTQEELPSHSPSLSAAVTDDENNNNRHDNTTKQQLSIFIVNPTLSQYVLSCLCFLQNKNNFQEMSNV